MKWIVILYVIFMMIEFSFVILFRKKEDDWKHENLFSYFFLLHIYFLSCFCFLCYKDHENIFALIEENKILLHKKQEKEVAIKQVWQEVKTIESIILGLDEIMNELNQSKRKLMDENTNLEKTYNDLYRNTTSYQIENFPTFYQKKEYPNGCEAIALYLLLKYHKVNVTPEEIVAQLRKGDSPYIVGGVRYGADPEIEFVGNPKSYSGYGVFENPIIDVANHFKSGVIKATGKTLDEVLAIVKSGHPVQVWASSYQKTPTKCDTWISTSDSLKRKITWYCNFHSLVLIGATPDKVIVSDSLTGTIVNYDKDKFEYAYNFYGRRAIYYES